MSDVIVEITMSLDGFVTGPNDGPEHGLGENGEVLHYWAFGGPWSMQNRRPMEPVGVDKDALDHAISGAGASVCGRRMYDITNGWGGQSPYGVPTIVVTHRTADQPDPSSGFLFIDGIEPAISTARDLAGDKDVNLGGGASVIQQAFAADLVDRLHLHIAPVILGAGRPLFGENGLGKRIHLEPVGDLTESQWATHARYNVVR
jgi:dihydrofolate reductase